MSSLEEIRADRLRKAEELRRLGIDPYPSKSSRDGLARDVVSSFEKFEGKEVTVGGRLMSMREHGGILFADLVDESGKIQLYIKKDELSPTNIKNGTLGFEHINLFDIGDFVEARGVVTKTKRGEISVLPETLRMLAKSLRPLPEKWAGLEDPEIIYRRRYLDLTVNPERRKLFERKSRFWDVNRAFMRKEGFLEVETPILEHVTGGADARPFVTHHNALDEDFYLRISTELYLKRLIGGGFEKVYTLGPNFRNEGIDEEHLQEYYQIEWYWAYANYRDNMELAKECMRYVAKELYGKTEFTRGPHTFDLSRDWEEIDYAKAIRDQYGFDIFEVPDKEMLAVLKKKGVDLPGVVTRHRLIDNLWKLIRKDIAGPAFLVNQPKFISPLAKSRPDDPRLTERFQIIIAGSELANGYSELNDPLDQLARFQEQQAAREAGDEEAQMLDIDFVEMLEYGMPPVSGYAHSERLFWFLEGISAREGTLFPQMRRKVDPLTKKIYNLKETKSKKRKK